MPSQFLSRTLLILVIATLFIIIFVALSMLLEAEHVQLLRYTTVLNSSIETIYSFNPCEGSSSPGLFIEIRFVATKPVTLFVVDEEQYRELFSRSDLYGYLAYASSTSGSKLRFYYAKSIPCWPIYVVAKGIPGTRIDLRIVISRSG